MKIRCSSSLPSLLMIVGSFTSCKRDDCVEIVLENYSVDIQFSSFFSCGVDHRIALTTRPGPLTYGEHFEPDKLYVIRIQENCDKPQRDTVALDIGKIQRDSIFDLANDYVANVKMDNHRLDCDQTITPIVHDGGNVSVEVCFANQCRSHSLFNYAHLNKAAPGLVGLLNYLKKLETVSRKIPYRN